MANMKNNDNYERYFTDPDDLRLEISNMEENSTWHRDIPVKECELHDFGEPLIAMGSNDIQAYHFDPEMAMDTISYGTRLFMVAGGIPLLVRRSALGSLYQTAKLSGTALKIMAKESPWKLAETLNYGFSVVSGKAIALERFGKLSACHSDGDGGYAIMPISELFDISKKALEDKFGYIELIRGYNSHERTEALWYLVDAQTDLVDKYQKALEQIKSKYSNLRMPGIRFMSSDTSNTAAVLEPVFITDTGAAIKFSEGVRVKHRRAPSGEKQPMDVFEEEAGTLYAKFEETFEKLAELATIQVYHPQNFVVSVCKKLRIPKKYGEAARSEAEDLAIGAAFVNGHDMYICMNKIIEAAMESGASGRVLAELDEKVSKIPSMDFSEHDVGGLVAWSD